MKEVTRRKVFVYSFSSERILALGLVTRMASCWARSTKVFLEKHKKKPFIQVVKQLKKWVMRWATEEMLFN